ncbi:uncharacterized protein BCR38DRAFT_407462 [Pseudomassariella vexata]|uniref:SWIRM domain-containing protein n=1 Tax=Pseudomassariella vexata TaxID=1141098 RepID=A0A1Y2E9E8_9PEZI|nr:uncharacterized protein BCR38DRAFT_407462 [Pseudomassariella vexata]ORY67485.1 hypothetical protein BCR38DRAFT_407462 [Pseudomassariella vexata]
MADKPTSPAMQASTTFGHQSPQSSTIFMPFPRSQVTSNNSTMVSIDPSSPTEPKKPFDISNLMSPPELPPFDSFAQSSVAKRMGSITSEMRRLPGPNPPLSPPISPRTKTDDHTHSAGPSSNMPVKDPILYPAQDITSSPPQQPLFVRDHSVETQRIVDDHLVARPASLFRAATPPEREDYELMLFFQSQVMKKYNENPRGWLQRERALLLADRRAGARHAQFRLHPLLPATKPQTIRSQAQRVMKPSKMLKSSRASVPRPIRSNLQPQKQPVVRRVSVTPDPASRRMVAPNREDKDFASLPDYCPPLNSLPTKSNSLKVDWKGAPIDLSGDPHRELLHADEVTLAANLRLDCATYLTSKRRMFVKRLECLRIGKEFRKTDAQQACKIDVNKASKLWTAFDKVGWLEKRWVSPLL